MSRYDELHPDDEALIALALRSAFPEPADELRLRRGEHRVRAAAAALAEEDEPRPATTGPRHLAPGRMRRLATTRQTTAATLAVLMMVLSGTGISAASTTSMPGEMLYPVKHAMERAWVLASPGDVASARAELRIAERRLDEVEQVLGTGGADGWLPGLWAAFESSLDRARLLGGDEVAQTVAALTTRAEQLRGQGGTGLAGASAGVAGGSLVGPDDRGRDVADDGAADETGPGDSSGHAPGEPGAEPRSDQGSSGSAGERSGGTTGERASPSPSPRPRPSPPGSPGPGTTTPGAGSDGNSGVATQPRPADEPLTGDGDADSGDDLRDRHRRDTWSDVDSNDDEDEDEDDNDE